ncbi:MAG: hypothetical protein A3C53_05440 [Omnitrophica WOR_2 bacterium RIFCSPHIGHO2_02_FULL_68_15]|nr:MAG: hypothetical protein A3C53_05440 [Omnitrophica WOR_2 bacterium RIFCSPHIGHO2_02_FULL_68_15]
MTSRSVEQEHYANWLFADRVTRYWLVPILLVTLLLARWLGLAYPLLPCLLLLAGFLGYNSVLVRALKHRSRLIPDTIIYFVTMLLNGLVLSAAIHYTGGIESLLVPMTAVLVIFSALFLTFIQCLCVSLVAALGYGLTLILEGMGLLRHYHVFPSLPAALHTDAIYVLMMSLGVVAVLLVLGLVAGYLAAQRRHHSEQLARMQLRLEEWNRDLELRVDEKTQSLRAMHEQLQQAYYGTVKAFMQALEAKDPDTRHHSHAVAVYARLIGEEMGFSGERLVRLEQGCQLHDIGKIAIPDHILLKPGPLTKEEFEIVKQHPSWGARILEPLTFMKDVTEVVLQEHERWDGRGYPNGLKGEAVSIEARIVAVADAWDAMTSARPYRAPMPLESAIAELQRGAGTQFDPAVVKAFLRVIRQGKLPASSPHDLPPSTALPRPFDQR